jgi:hypothetical protein
LVTQTHLFKDVDELSVAFNPRECVKRLKSAADVCSTAVHVVSNPRAVVRRDVVVCKLAECKPDESLPLSKFVVLKDCHVETQVGKRKAPVTAHLVGAGKLRCRGKVGSL